MHPMFEITVLEIIRSRIILHGDQAMMTTAIGVQGGAVSVAAGAGGGAPVPVIRAAKVDHAAGVGAGVLNDQRVGRVARAEPVGGATVEVAAEVEAAVADKVEPGAGQGARAVSVATAEKGAAAEGGVAVGAEASVTVAAAAVAAAAEAAGAPVGVITAGVSDRVRGARTLVSWRRHGDVRKYRILLYNLQSPF